MNCYIVESATETGNGIKYLNCRTSQTWVDDIEEASRFVTLELAEQLANDWSDHFAMKGMGRYANVTTEEDARFCLADVDSQWSE